MATDEDERYHRYCKDVCGGKCCTLHDPDEGPVPCPNLTRQNTCRIYAKRYAPGAPDLVQVGRYKSKVFVNKATGKPALRPFLCGRIEQLLAAGRVPPHIRDQCCYHDAAVLEDLP
jgi:hypothetical protein